MGRKGNGVLRGTTAGRGGRSHGFASVGEKTRRILEGRSIMNMFRGFSGGISATWGED